MVHWHLPSVSLNSSTCSAGCRCDSWKADWSLGRMMFCRCLSWWWVDESCSVLVFLCLRPGGRHLLGLPSKFDNHIGDNSWLAVEVVSGGKSSCPPVSFPAGQFSCGSQICSIFEGWSYNCFVGSGSCC